MRTRLIAALEFALLSPAALFMGALVVRSLQPLQYEPAHSAQQVVMWYAGRMWTLWVLLLALPFTVLITGCAAVLRSWPRGMAAPHNVRRSLAFVREHLATLVVAATTLAAAVIVVIVVLHMAAD
jgi:hypothetical protein